MGVNHVADLRVFSDAEQLARGAALEVTRLVESSLRTNSRFTVVLSGGGTPKALYSVLADEDFPWDKIHFFWGDERHAPPTDPESNFRMANEALLSRVSIPAENIHRIRAEDADPSKAADDYERELQTFFNSGSGELPRFDLVLLGLGTDGHIASLFPDSAALQERNRQCVSNWVEKLQTWRITLTLPVLNNASRVMFLVSGAEKSAILRAVLKETNYNPYPAQLIQPTDGSVMWLVDGSAASLLSRDS